MENEQRQRIGSGMKKVSELFPSVRGIKSVLNDSEFCDFLRREWETLLGGLSGEVLFGFFRNGVLGVDVKNFVWVSEIPYLEKEIIEKIKKLWHKKTPVVKAIKVSYNQAELTPKCSEIYLDRAGLSFGEKIAFENAEKQKKGFRLCSNCRQVLAPSNICIFCEAKATLL